ncbi:PDZ domain-containing protein [Sphingomonas koreensis]|nr:PDZ domain-containing protein [Sphingomonas koreensis]
MKYAAFALGFGLLFASPAAADEMFAVMPSGQPEMDFPGQTQKVVGEISSKCIDAHWTVISSTGTDVTCEAPLNFGQSVLGQVLMGNSYSTPPRRFFRFNIADVNGISRVVASGWVELQMAFGQTRRTDLSGATFDNDVMVFLAAAGGKYPVGTTFPNHAVIGVDGKSLQDGKYQEIQVTSLQPGSAAEAAGIQVGDVIIEIDGKRFKNNNDYLDATAKAAKGSSYPVEFERQGEKQTATVATKFRPTITEAVVASGPIDAPAPMAPSSAAAPSLIDQLSKLAEMRDHGDLTASEFEAAKAKLLSQN